MQIRSRSVETNGAFVDYYRCPESLATFVHREFSLGDCGYFQFGPNALGYGRCSSSFPAKSVTDSLHDALKDVKVEEGTLCLPFDPSEIAANLRYERYASSNGNGKRFGTSSMLRELYYTVRPLLSQAIRKRLQRMYFRDWEEIRFPKWPVDSSVECIFQELMLLLLRAHAVDRTPFIWFWPEGLPACAIMTHDAETLSGRDFCSKLMDVDDAYGIKSSFQIVPEGRYPVSQNFLRDIRDRGFEINIHDLEHDGRLFSDRELFLRRAERINRYGREFQAAGFRSAVLYRNADWFGALDFAYDMSIPSVGSLEVQRGGCCSVTPFFIGNILELPTTTVQDYCLFHILDQYSIGLWKRQIALISDTHGLASFLIHPDYVLEARAMDTYKALLTYLAELRSEKKIWIARPGEVDQWWRERSQMRLTRRDDVWEIEGPGKERARIAYAIVEDNQLSYRVQSSSASTVNAI